MSLNQAVIPYDGTPLRIKGKPPLGNTESPIFKVQKPVLRALGYIRYTDSIRVSSHSHQLLKARDQSDTNLKND